MELGTVDVGGEVGEGEGVALVGVEGGVEDVDVVVCSWFGGEPGFVAGDAEGDEVRGGVVGCGCGGVPETEVEG